jgi:TolA-binding protein
LPGDVWRESAAAAPAAPLGDARRPAAAASAPIAASAAIEPAHRVRAADFAQPAPAARPAPAAVEIAREPPPPETAPPPLAPATEAATVAEALHALRASGDARGALVALARYERDFPAGLLRREASLARAEALLALRRPTEALAALDPLELEIGLANRRATLLRGDLRAGAGRCAQAEIDFTHVLAAGDDDESAARALYGRGVCRLGRGDAAGARADFQAYSSRFPSGEQRAEVARALGRLGK